MTLALRQPTRRREWELRHGEELLASLQLPAMRRGGKARVGDRELEIRASGLLKVEHLVVDAGTGEEVATVRQNVLEGPGLDESSWTSLGRGKGHGFVTADGEPWLRAKVSSGLIRTSGQLEVAPGHEVAVPALMAAYLLMRKAEEVASSVAATTVVAP